MNNSAIETKEIEFQDAVSGLSFITVALLGNIHWYLNRDVMSFMWKLHITFKLRAHPSRKVEEGVSERGRKDGKRANQKFWLELNRGRSRKR